MPRAPLELVQGTVDVLILKSLSWGSRHGYAITSWIRTRTHGVLGLQDAALYKGLHRLEDKGLVESEWGPSENNRRAKYYRLTADGRAALRAETSTWREYAAAIFQVLDARESES